MIRTSALLALHATLVALALAPNFAGAQALSPATMPNSGTQAFTLASPSMGVTFEILVRTPPAAIQPAGKKFPALIVTDGFMAFGMANDAATWLESSTIEPRFIVSIGSKFSEGEEEHTRRRIYEFSTDWPMNDPFGQGVKGFCERFKSPPGHCVGGAPKFLGVIVDELIPQLAKQFPIDTAQLGLFGVSAGGFFVSWAIFQDKSPFKSYLISSPAMAYGDGAIFREEARYAASHKDLHVSVFVATGSLEFDDPYLEGIGKIASGHAQFVAALRGRKYPNLKLNNEIMNGMGHGDSAPAALVRGMRTLYGKP